MSNRNSSFKARPINRAVLAFVASALLSCTISPAQASGSTQAPAEVQHLIAAYSADWDRADGRALGAAYVPNGDLMIPTGELFVGPEVIAGFYTSVFKRGYGGTRAEGTIERFRYVANDVALIDGTWGILGIPDAGNRTHDEHGVFSAVLVNTAGHWRIASLREQSSAQRLLVTPAG